MAAEHAADAGQQLDGVERLADIVIGARVKRRHLVHLLSPGGNHEDGHAAPFPKARQKFQAIHVGQSQIEQDGIGAARRGQGHTLLPIHGFEAAIAAALQGHPQQLTEARFIFHHQDQGPEVIHGTSRALDPSRIRAAGLGRRS
jgi:hypothetical protein